MTAGIMRTAAVGRAYPCHSASRGHAQYNHVREGFVREQGARAYTSMSFGAPASTSKGRENEPVILDTCQRRGRVHGGSRTHRSAGLEAAHLAHPQNASPISRPVRDESRELRDRRSWSCICACTCVASAGWPWMGRAGHARRGRSACRLQAK